MKKLVEPMPAIIEHPLGGQGHLVSRPARIGQVLPGKAIHGLVDRLGLGETRGGVIEIDHGGLNTSPQSSYRHFRFKMFVVPPLGGLRKPPKGGTTNFRT